MKAVFIAEKPSVAAEFACAGWSDNQIPVVREYMQKYCDYYLKTTAELEKILYKD